VAGDALDTAPPHAFERDPVLTDGDAQVLALLTARRGADPAAVVRTVLRSLTEPAHAHLLEGLGAYLATGSATAAAESLRLHPQTLRYRLRRATDLTGRDPRDQWQRLTLDIAMHIVQSNASVTRRRPAPQGG
jgi:DNA-binding PucR family transcriptional regulator